MSKRDSHHRGFLTPQKAMEQSGPIALQDLLSIFHAQLHHPVYRGRNRKALREIVDTIAVVEEAPGEAAPRLVLRRNSSKDSGAFCCVS